MSLTETDTMESLETPMPRLDHEEPDIVRLVGHSGWVNAHPVAVYIERRDGKVVVSAHPCGAEFSADLGRIEVSVAEAIRCGGTPEEELEEDDGVHTPSAY
jgi:hypothetical protein